MKLLFSLALLLVSVICQASEWALVNVSVACIREGCAHSTGMASQAVMGTPLKVMANVDDCEWIKVQTPDGYEGFVNISSLTLMDSAAMNLWRKSPRLVVGSMDEIKVMVDTLDVSPRNIVTELTLSSIVGGQKGHGRYTRVALPDGRKGWVETRCVDAIEDWAAMPLVTDRVLDCCYFMMGSAYLWGGCSTKGADCSGLVSLSHYARGIITPRDAWQQMEAGTLIAPDAPLSALQPADLLFFSSTPDGRITHVALYIGDGKYIHDSGRVKISEMDGSDPDFSGRVYRGAVRVADSLTGVDGGFRRVAGHPWYFLNK